MCHDKEKWCRICRGMDLWFENWYEKSDEFWPEYSRVSKIFTFSLGLKYITFDLRKYGGVIFDSTEDWCKIWRETDLRFQNLHE